MFSLWKKYFRRIYCWKFKLGPPWFIAGLDSSSFTDVNWASLSNRFLLGWWVFTWHMGLIHGYQQSGYGWSRSLHVVALSPTETFKASQVVMFTDGLMVYLGLRWSLTYPSTRAQGYKTSFILNSVEHEIFPANKY